MSLQISQTAGLVSVNTTSTAKSVDLPLTSQRQGRVITIKDGYGFANIRPITINTTGGNTFEDGSTQFVLNLSFGSVTFVAKGAQWVKTCEVNPALPSTLNGLATFGYVSSLSLQSTMVGLNTSLITSSLTVSSISFGNDFGFLNLGNLQTDILSSQRIYTSTINVDGSIFLYDKDTTTYGNITLSNATLYINGNAITGGGGGGGSGDVTSTNLTSTTLGLGTLGYLSSFRSISSLNVSTGRFYAGEGVFSTLHVNMNPGDAPFWNNSNQAAGFDPEPNPLAVDVFGSMRVLKNIYIGSTTTVIGTSGIIAGTISSIRTIASSIGLYNPTNGSLKYITLNSLGNLTVGGQQIITTVSSFADLHTNLFEVSTITMNDVLEAGLSKDLVLSNGTLFIGGVPVASGGGAGGGDVISTQLISTTSGLTSNLGVALGSTINNLGSFRYLSAGTVTLISSPVLDSTLQSTIRGLGTFGYLSSATVLLNLVSTPLLDSTLQSTVRGLGTFGYLSTAVTNLSAIVSTPLLDSTLRSTVAGLGLSGYISSSQLLSTTASYRTTFTTASSVTSSMTASSITSVQGYVSSLTVDMLTIGTGTGWINMGPIQATAISSLQENTGALYATTAYIGNTSTLNQIRFWGLFGNYNNTILAEVSTGSAVGAQEFLVFKGSSASDRIRFQTTGDIRFEPQVAAREFSTATALATPTMILQSNLVGVNTATPVALLDVRGTAFLTTLSTQQAFLSSVNGIAFANLISTSVLESTLQSTVRGLGTIGYISTASSGGGSGEVTSTNLTSTTLGLGTLGYVSSSTLVSTVAGLGLLGYISSATLASTLQSTVRGLGTIGYLSAGTTTLISSPVLDSTLQSTVRGLGTLGYLSAGTTTLISSPVLDSTLQSTVRGLGTIGYLSTATTVSFSNLVSTPLLDSTLQSTVRGLGSFGYLSSYVSSFNFLSAGIFLNSSIAANVVSTNSLFVNNLVARSTNISSLYVSNLRVVQSYISSLSIDELQIGSGDGWTDTGPLRATYISSLQENTGALYATTVFVGNTSTLNQIRFWGLQGNYNNTILAEISTGSAVGAQEFLVFKGSSASDRIRFQTTGDIRFEPQVAAREFSTATALATPTMILQSNLVGLNTATPVALLDVRGTAFVTTLSTQQAFVSSLNGVAFANLISTSVLDSTLQSTVRGLGTIGYLSSATTVSFSNLVSTPLLDSTLQSTVQGLSAYGYVSSLSLQSTMVGLNTSLITSSLTVSSISFGNDFGFLNLGNLQTDILSSQRIYTSTINVDGSLFVYDKQTTTYGNITLSNATLFINGNAITGGGGGGGSGDVTSTNLTSTTLGLGTLGYTSTLSANIGFVTVSTSLLTTSTITFIDSLTPARYNVFAQNSFLYYGSTIIGGAKTATPQFITF